MKYSRMFTIVMVTINKKGKRERLVKKLESLLLFKHCGQKESSKLEKTEEWYINFENGVEYFCF